LVNSSGSAPKIALLAADWQPRALIRAQLIEEGFDVAATDTWDALRALLRPGSKPQLVIVDLKGLPEPAAVLRDLRVLIKPDRVLLLNAIGLVSPEDVERSGFRSLSRPVTIAHVVRTAAEAIREAASDHSQR
jgi:hypothetical protein